MLRGLCESLLPESFFFLVLEALVVAYCNFSSLKHLVVLFSVKRIIPFYAISACQFSFTGQFTGLLIEDFDVCSLALRLVRLPLSTHEANNTRLLNRLLLKILFSV